MSDSLQEKLQELLQFAKKHGLMEIVWKDGDLKIAFRRSLEEAEIPVPATVESTEEEPAPKDDRVFVKSPIVGTFRRAVAKGRPPLIMVGNHIKPGDPLAVVECMKIPTDVVSYASGEIKEILVEDGQAVEYGQPLFSIVPNGNGHSNGAQ